MAKLLQLGSQGKDVKTLQQSLNTKGYNLGVDGIFGKQTLSAVKDFQKSNGLAVDGLVGKNTLAALGGGVKTNLSATDTSGSTSTTTSGYTPTAAPSAYTPTAAPTIGALPTAPTYDTSTWDESTKGQSASGAYNTAKDAVNNYEDFSYSNQAQLDTIMNSILNRQPFSYDFNEDAFYHMYADKYGQQAQMAMADTMGQAAAMTGGFGNSYVQSVGHQAYTREMQNLNDKIPELYQLALDKYKMEGQDLYNQYGMLTDDRSTEYGMWNDGYNKLMDALGIARSDYYDGANMYYTEQNNKNSVASQQFNDAMSLWTADTENKWKQAEWTESNNRYGQEDKWKQAEWTESNNRYANDEIWRQKEYDLNDRQVSLQEDSLELQKGQIGATKNSDGSYTVPKTTTTPTLTAAEYNTLVTNAATYAEQGEAALDNYLGWYVDMGYLTREKAQAIYLQYFPQTTVPDPNGIVTPSGTYKTGGGGFGGNPITVELFN